MTARRWRSNIVALAVALTLSVLALRLTRSALAGPLEDAAAAYDRGDYATAARLYRPLAEQGAARAEYSLGFMYATGQGVAQDFPAAMTWYRKAADQGDASAQNNLGVMYAEGYGVTRDYGEAVKWYRKAADRGNVLAQNNLGFMYANGPRRDAKLRRGDKVVRAGRRTRRRQRSVQPRALQCERARRAPERRRGDEVVPQGGITSRRISGARLPPRASPRRTSNAREPSRTVLWSPR